MNLRSAATTALAIVVALTLASGSASAADHEKASAAVTRQAVVPSGPGTAAAGAGHTDERMSG